MELSAVAFLVRKGPLGMKRGRPGRQGGGGVRICTENARRGGLPRRGGQDGEGEGSGSVCGELGGGGYGGAKYFISGPKCPPRSITLFQKESGQKAAK